MMAGEEGEAGMGHSAKRKLDILDQYESPTSTSAHISPSKKSCLPMPILTTRLNANVHVDDAGSPLGLNASFSRTTSSTAPDENDGSQNQKSRDTSTSDEKNETTTDADSQMAVEILQRLLEHSVLRVQVDELTAYVNSLTKSKATAEEKCLQLSEKYEKVYNDLLDSNDDLAEKNKQINIEIGRNQKHLDTITDLVMDLKVRREEIERLTKLNDSHYKDRQRFRELEKSLSPQKGSPSKQANGTRSRRNGAQVDSNAAGQFVLEFYLYNLHSKHFETVGTLKTSTAEVTNWLQLWRTARKNSHIPDGGNETMAQVQDVVFGDTYVTISPKYFPTWLECLKVEIVGKRRCRCLWFSKHLSRESAQEAARNIR